MMSLELMFVGLFTMKWTFLLASGIVKSMFFPMSLQPNTMTCCIIASYGMLLEYNNRFGHCMERKHSFQCIGSLVCQNWSLFLP